jgi:protein SCO1/2
MTRILASTIFAIVSLGGLTASAIEGGYNVNHTPLQTSDQKPAELTGVGVTEHRGQKLPLDLEFQNEMGANVKLGEYFNQGRPVMMAMVYYDCPNLCNMQLNGFVDVIKKMNLRLGQDYDLVAVSMDSKETPALAAKKKANYIKSLGLVDAGEIARIESHWHFLVGQEAAVKDLAQTLGFSYKWDAEQKQFSHAAATYLVTPSGELSRYIYGIEFQPDTMRLGLVEAGQGQIGTIIDQVSLFCFQFNPHKNKYVLYSFNLMRAGACLMVILLAVFLIPYWMRERRRRPVG